MTDDLQQHLSRSVADVVRKSGP